MTEVVNYIILPKLARVGPGYASGTSIAFTYASLLSGIGAHRSIEFFKGFIEKASEGATLRDALLGGIEKLESIDPSDGSTDAIVYLDFSVCNYPLTYILGLTDVSEFIRPLLPNIKLLRLYISNFYGLRLTRPKSRIEYAIKHEATFRDIERDLSKDIKNLIEGLRSDEDKLALEFVKAGSGEDVIKDTIAASAALKLETDKFIELILSEGEIKVEDDAIVVGSKKITFDAIRYISEDEEDLKRILELVAEKARKYKEIKSRGEKFVAKAYLYSLIGRMSFRHIMVGSTKGYPYALSSLNSKRPYAFIYARILSTRDTKYIERFFQEHAGVKMNLSVQSESIRKLAYILDLSAEVYGQNRGNRQNRGNYSPRINIVTYKEGDNLVIKPVFPIKIDQEGAYDHIAKNLSVFSGERGRKEKDVVLQPLVLARYNTKVREEDIGERLKEYEIIKLSVDRIKKLIGAKPGTIKDPKVIELPYMKPYLRDLFTRAVLPIAVFSVFLADKGAIAAVLSKSLSTKTSEISPDTIRSLIENNPYVIPGINNIKAEGMVPYIRGLIELIKELSSL